MDSSRAELVQVVQQLIDAKLSAEAENRFVAQLKSSVPHPRVTDLIYYNTPKLTAEQVADRAEASVGA
ncbi:bacteriocin immunity protein [Streptomyces canus]